MWNDKETITKEQHSIAMERKSILNEKELFAKDQEIAKLKAGNLEKSDLQYAQDKIKSLEADLKIEKSRNATIEAQKKAEYAEHVMKVADDRVKELAEIYQNYAKNLTDVVKASHPQAVNNILKS